MTGVAIRDNISSIVEFRLRPTAARWQFQLYLFGDKEMYYFWQPDMRSIQMRGVMLYQPAGIRNMSHIIAMFDSGAGVEIMVSPVGSLMLNVYLPNTFINITNGLLGLKFFTIDIIFDKTIDKTFICTKLLVIHSNIKQEIQL